MERGEQAITGLQNLSQRGTSVVTCATLLLGIRFGMQFCSSTRSMSWSVSRFVADSARAKLMAQEQEKLQQLAPSARLGCSAQTRWLLLLHHSMVFSTKEMVAGKMAVMQALGLHTTENAEASSEDDDAADDQSDAASSSEDDADIDDLDDLEDESDAASSASGSDEEEDEDEGPAKPSSSAGLAMTKVKKQKTGNEASGLGSVGWEASDEEDERPAVVLAAGTVLQLCSQIKLKKSSAWF